MVYFLLQTYSDLTEIAEQLWAVDEDDYAHKLNVTGDEKWPLADLPTIFEGSVFTRLNLAPGQYFPRMARPYSTCPGASPGFNPERTATFRNARGASSGHLHAMIDQLQHICRVVHPCEDNMNSYGHETRNLLILACTEVEAQCKNVLAANGVRTSWGTKSYARLAPAMRLGEYRVALNWYPWLDPIAPFDGWEPGERSTQSLPWYDAYNKVKHDRETCFHLATLGSALFAVAGSFVMRCAQYGWDFALKDKDGERAFFQLVGAPDWPKEEIYINGDLAPMQYFQVNLAG